MSIIAVAKAYFFRGVLAAVVGAGAGAVSCSGLDSQTAEPNSDESVSSVDHVEGVAFDSRAFVFDVAGTEVITETADGLLPRVAGRIKSTSTLTILTSGEASSCGGLESASMFPPRCAALPLHPFVPALLLEFGEESGGVTFGYVTATLQLDGNGVGTVIDIAEPEDRWVYEVPTPTECVGTAPTLGSFEAAGLYQQRLGEDNTGTVYRSIDDIVVFEVLDNPDDHVVALEQVGIEACVVTVERSLAELRAIQDRLFALRGELPPMSTAPSSDGRLTVDVVYADMQVVEEIAEASGNPDALRIIGHSVFQPSK